MQLDIMAL